MVLGILFLSLALSSAAHALLNGPLLTGFFSLGLLGAAAGWLGAGPRIFGKRPDGTVPHWAYPLHWSWYALATVSFYGRRWSTGEDAWNTVAPNLIVGRRLVAAERARLNDLPLSAILDMTAEFNGVRMPDVPFLNLPVLDGTAPTHAQLDQAVAWIDEHIHDGPVYVHCMMGHGRSATAAAAWLMRHNPGLSVEAAQAQLRIGRPRIRLAPDQRRALRTWRS
ncbi:MAG: dual specificity protein phosphatase family protein [Myxococcota bacterium]